MDKEENKLGSDDMNTQEMLGAQMLMMTSVRMILDAARQVDQKSLPPEMVVAIQQLASAAKYFSKVFGEV